MRRQLPGGADCFYFFEKKCRKEKSHPVLFSKKILEKYKGVLWGHPFLLN
jgi:hypothetical protein